MATTFDPINYKKTTRDQWLGAATETMLDLANVHSGSRVLDVVAGAGGQTLTVARRVGPSGYVLATDISSSSMPYRPCSRRHEIAPLAFVLAHLG